MLIFPILASLENIEGSLRMLKKKLDDTLKVTSRCISKLNETKAILTELETNFEGHELAKYMVERTKWARDRDAKQLAESNKK